MSTVEIPDDDLAMLARASPASFAHFSSRGGWIPFEHLIVLDQHLQAAANREIDRLIVNMPPRHGKSELVSRHFPAWYLGRFPDRQVIMLSYGADLIWGHSRAARDLLMEHGPSVFGVQLRPGSSSAKEWHLADHDGVVLASPMGGSITGYGANVLLIDDPLKDEKEAASQLKRDTVWDRYQATASTRLMSPLLGGAIVIVVQTRWHEDDLTGRILNSKGAARWTHINMPALAEADGDLLGRPEGQALCPELFDEEHFKRLREEGMSQYFFNALYQQRPTAPEGFLFKRAHFRYWGTETVQTAAAIHTTYYVLREEKPVSVQQAESGLEVLERRYPVEQCTTFQTADVAISDDDMADYTVVSTWATTPHGDLLLLHRERRHFEEQQIAAFMKRCADDQGRPPMWVERFGAGRSPLSRMRTDGYPVFEVPEEAGTKLDKVTRAFGAIGMYEQHKIWHPDPRCTEWLDEWENELTSFPLGAHDDQVDTVSYAARLVPIMPRADGPPVVARTGITKFSRGRFPT